MTFKIIYFVGKSKREKIINADSLEHAQEICDSKIPGWQDIITITKNRTKQ